MLSGASKPSQDLAQIESDFPGIWRKIEAIPKLRVRPGVIHVTNEHLPAKVLAAGDPHPFAVPLSTMRFSSDPSAVEALANVIRSGRRPDDRLLMYSAEWVSALASWRSTKLIYAYDEDFFEELFQTPLTGAPPGEIFDHLPADSFFVSWGRPRPDLDPIEAPQGMYVLREEGAITLVVGPTRALTMPLGEDGLDVELARKAGLNDLTERELVKINALKKGINIDEALARFDSTRAKRLERAKADYHRYWGGLLSVLLYLCAEKPELSDAVVPRARVSPMGKAIRTVVPKQETTSNVGVRLGAIFRKNREDSEQENRSQGGDTGIKMPAHVRRAHWHTYLTGSRDAPVRVLRWLSPILVNAKSSDDLTDTVHPVESSRARQVVSRPRA